MVGHHALDVRIGVRLPASEHLYEISEILRSPEGDLRMTAEQW